jgi:ATP-dependent Lhr-like helicase
MAAAFHPLVSQWFSDTLGQPTRAQRLGWDAIGSGRHTLIAAPTGSGKTLAAFLTALDGLFQEGLSGPLPDEVRVVYVSPLKALSADIHKNLAIPRREIAQRAEAAGIDPPRITAAVRTGDTTSSERAAMIRTPPHILVTTPESLYLLLTSERSRQMLRTVGTVIVDEIHAVIGTRRGAHLALTLERLQEVATAPLVRIGLSATQKPVETVADFLVGQSARTSGDRADCVIVDDGHRRAIDLALELPKSSLEAVMSNEIWEEYYDRLADLVRAHRTTLIFVNTRRLAERVARHLSDRLGEAAVTAHHGSLSKERRLDAEARLKGGTLRALVATASLELGIDIGHVDLVCQIASPHRIATLLQRVGRSGHSISGMPKGRLFPTSRDDLVECVALLRAIRHGDLDRIVSQEAPNDVLAQQIVAETACREYTEDELFALVKKAWPYRSLERARFDAIITMLADGFSTRRGRRGALIYRDEVGHRLHGRRGSQLLAVTSGGAIPEVADYRMVLEPDDTFIGTLNEDFAIESNAGDVIQLGNMSWRVLQVGSGTIRVADAKGAPPTIPFWLGEAPARSDELSLSVSDLRRDIDDGLETQNGSGSSNRSGGAATLDAIAQWVAGEAGVDRVAADQAVSYLADTRAVLGAIPTQDTLVLERFFDESGGMQLVLHSPFGSRINRAWGLALRKRFCRQFNFELQAAATEDALMLSLGLQHSFPLADVFRYLHPATAEDVLVQAMLDAPVFQTRWRWNTTISLAVPRFRGGRKVPAQLQRMLAEDLLASVFPDAAACLENIPGDRQLPDHPLVNQTIRDCLEEAMDFRGLARVLSRIHAGEIRLVTRDTPEPSPFSHEILNARPYAFLDDAPLEERRSHAVYTRRASEPASANDLGALDPSAIARVRDEQRPDPRDADELHDALMTAGFLTADEAALLPGELFEALERGHRAASVAIDSRGRPSGRRPTIGDSAIWIAAERAPEFAAIHGQRLTATLDVPATRASRQWTRDEAVAEIFRGRLSIAGPTTARDLAAGLGISSGDADAALIALETDGAVLRGRFTGIEPLEWCDRRLLARIHRYTLNRLRAEIEPISPADFQRFLFAWHGVDPAHRFSGVDGLRAVVTTLDGFELPASAWERAVLPARVDRYDPAWLDTLCLAGEAGWARLSRADTGSEGKSGLRVALLLREHADAWQTLRFADESVVDGIEERVSPDGRQVLEWLRGKGASFLNEIVRGCALGEPAVRQAVAALAVAGLVVSDGFAGVRAVTRTLRHRPQPPDRRQNPIGRWSSVNVELSSADREAAIELQAKTLLARYGIVFRRLLTRETNASTWRSLTGVYRRLEARGEIRGGRFVSGMSGEQFALPEAVERVREMRRSGRDGRLISLSAVDPLNLTGILTSGERVRSLTSNRLVYRDGVVLAAREGDYMRPLAEIDPATAESVATVLAGRPLPAVTSGFVGR